MRDGFIPTTSRRTFLSTAIASLCLIDQARADVPLIRYATNGLVGPGELESVVLSDWMKSNVLKRHGRDYRIEAISARGSPEVMTLMAAGSVDMGTGAFPVLATSILRDVVPGGVSAVAEIHRDGQPGYASNPFCVLDDSSIRSIGDLKGKTVAVNSYGTIVDIILRFALKRAGLNPKTDVNIVELSFPSIAPALRQRRIDAGVLVMPFQVDEMDKGGVRKLFDTTGLLEPYPILFQMVRNEFANKYPGALKSWLADYVEAQRWIYAPENRKEVIELTANLMKTDPKRLDSYFLTSRDFYRDPSCCLSTKSVQTATDVMSEVGVLPAHVSIAGAINNTYLPQPCGA